MRLFVLLHEAFGGRGGIAKFNRDLLRALSAHRGVETTVAMVRHAVEPVADLPERIEYEVVRGGKFAYAARVATTALMRPKFDMILAGHAHLLPFAFAGRDIGRTRVGLVVHGVEAWRPTGRRLTDALARRLDFFVAVSATTRSRFLSWSRLPGWRAFVLPNCVDLARFTPGEPDPALLRRLGVEGKRILLTLARLEAGERYKGIDEMIDVMPTLLAGAPDLVYVVAGDGSDRARLEAKAAERGVSAAMRFPGYVSEAEKRDLYRAASVFAMPGHGEGFGIVFLEAMACGAPVVASSVDGSREAVRDGDLGIVVNPVDPADIVAGVRRALARPRGRRPDGLDHFSFENFVERTHAIVDRVAAGDWARSHLRTA